MESKHGFQVFVCVIVFLLAAAVGGCGSQSSPKSASAGDKEKIATAAEQSKAPLVPKAQVIDWCKEHGVPESACTKCNESLIADFKKKGDWCVKHELPESQCITCHPELKAKLEAMAPKKTE